MTLLTQTLQHWRVAERFAALGGAGGWVVDGCFAGLAGGGRGRYATGWSGGGEVEVGGGRDMGFLGGGGRRRVRGGGGRRHSGFGGKRRRMSLLENRLEVPSAHGCIYVVVTSLEYFVYGATRSECARM
jgi:hypothetical protein